MRRQSSSLVPSTAISRNITGSVYDDIKAILALEDDIQTVADMVTAPAKLQSEVIIATVDVNTTFTVTGGYEIGTLIVHVDGQLVTDPEDYTATDELTIVFNAAVEVGAEVQITKLVTFLFDAKYLGALPAAPTEDSYGNPLTEGVLYFDTVLQEMYVYATGTWVSTSLTTPNKINIEYFTVVEDGETTFQTTTPYEIDAVAVYLNGVLVEKGVDYTATDGVHIVFTEGLAKDTTVQVLNLKVFNYNRYYLGPNAEAPLVNDDGDPLEEGTLYFNTVDNVMLVYTGSVWDELKPTEAEQASINTVEASMADVATVATDIANVNTVAGITADVAAVVANEANITTVATNIVDVAAVSTDIDNVNTAATNLVDINSFAEQYKISATAPSAPVIGTLWFDTAKSQMKVYTDSGWVVAGSAVNGTTERYVYTAIQDQTTFSAVYDTGYVDVYLNGIKLQVTADFTASDGATIELTSGANAGDIVDIVAYGAFEIADYSTWGFNTTYTPTGNEPAGTLYWDSDERTLSIVQNGTTLQTGQEIQWHVNNATGATILNGTPVMATGTLGASGRITVAPMDGTDKTNAKYLLGITTEDIAAGNDGKVTCLGKIRQVDTSAWNDGDVLYISNSTAGELTATVPVDLVAPVAFVVHSAVNGTLAVRCTPPDDSKQSVLKSSYVQVADAFPTSTHTIDYSLGDYQKITVTEALTLSTVNFVSGRVCSFIIELVNGGDYAITFPASWKFDSTTAPTLTSGGTDILLLLKDDDDVFTLMLCASGVGVVV